MRKGLGGRGTKNETQSGPAPKGRPEVDGTWVVDLERKARPPLAHIFWVNNDLINWLISGILLLFSCT